MALSRTRSSALALFASTVTAAGLLVPVAASAATPHLDPATLSRGADPSVAYMVRDTIRDGSLRVPATKQGHHDALWEVAGGYVVRDVDVGPRALVRVSFISRAGAERVIARSRDWIDVAVSASGRRVAVQRSSNATGLRTVISVSRPRSGHVLAHREMRLATLAAVTDHRVLVGLRARWHHPATVWWNYRRGTVRRIYGQAALGADVRHDKVVFDRTPVGEFCNRVAVLTRPARTLWHSCRTYPHQWSADGRHAIATHTYFDAAGTDPWWVLAGRTGQRRATVSGRLDKNAVWEDDAHFLTLGQSDGGQAAIVRCDLGGSCERASRLWDVPVPSDPSVFYAPPPVVLAGP